MMEKKEVLFSFCMRRRIYYKSRDPDFGAFFSSLSRGGGPGGHVPQGLFTADLSRKPFIYHEKQGATAIGKKLGGSTAGARRYPSCSGRRRQRGRFFSS